MASLIRLQYEQVNWGKTFSIEKRKKEKSTAVYWQCLQEMCSDLYSDYLNPPKTRKSNV